MWISKRRLRALEKRIADLEMEIQGQQNKKTDKMTMQDFSCFLNEYLKSQPRIKFPS